MALIEREAQLALLVQAWTRTLAGTGGVVLVHGEAGIGKTSLVQHFLDALPADTVRLAAGCEPLFAPRPLGPLLDLAESLPHAVGAALRAGPTHAGLFPDFLAFLRQPPSPKVLFLDDLHWADEGTLDLVRHVGRRLGGSSVLLIANYRDDDLGVAHPLRTLLGDLPAAATLRIAVPPLSRQAVEHLAGPARHAAGDVFRITGGNPFFVTEVLNDRDRTVPASVSDAVLARCARLHPRARALLELVSVSPKQLERAVVEALLDDTAARIDECVAHGLLRADVTALAFRHELARLAVEQALAPGRRVELHRQIFAALSTGSRAGTLAARRVHHAHAGELHDAVADLAPASARAAAAASSHRAAAALYELALRHADRFAPAERAQLFEAAADEHRVVGATDAALAATRAALALRTAQNDALGEGLNLRRLAATLWREGGDRANAEAMIERAVATLERAGPSVQLAHAYADLSRLRSAWSEYDESVRIGQRALALAETFDDARCLVEALHACGAARLFIANDPAAHAQLERALAVATQAHLDDAVAHLFATLQMAGVIHHDHARALAAADRGLAYCEARDLDAYVFRFLDNRALSLIELGRWPEAERDLERCLAAESIGMRLRNSLQFIRARQDARRGVDHAPAYWRALGENPRALPMGYRVPAIAAACAEVAWLSGDLATAQRVIRSGLDHALAFGEARLLGPLLVWARRCGLDEPRRLGPVRTPHAHEIDGRIDAAAAAWEQLGCRHERALALVHGDAGQVQEALREFERLGAAPAARIARARLRSLGADLPARGPLARTRADPLGLTARERQVYELLVCGLSNGAIAARLKRSERTVESHVARVLLKAKVASRVELAARAAPPMTAP